MRGFPSERLPRMTDKSGVARRLEMTAVCKGKAFQRKATAVPRLTGLRLGRR